MARNDRRYRNNRSYRNGRSSRNYGGDSKGKIIGLIVLGVIVLLLVGLSVFELNSKGGFYSMYFSIINGGKKGDVNEEAASYTLTQDQMKEDYDHLYHLLAENAPASFLGGDSFGYKFSDDAVYQKGLAEVKKCTSPEEFYAVMRAMTMMIPGSGAEAVTPLNTAIEKKVNGADLGRSETSVKTNLYGNNSYLYEQLVSRGKKIDPDLKLVYVEGEYAVVEKGKFYGTVEKMDDKDPVEYIKEGLYGSRIAYDTLRKKAYVPELYLYAREVTPLSRGARIEFDVDGSENKKKDYYLDYAADIMVGLYDEKTAAENAEAPKRINATSHTVYTYGDYDNEIGYIRVTAFNDSDFDAGHHDLNKTILDEVMNQKSFILDLRDCRGESREYAEEIFFAELFSADASVGKAYLLSSKGNTGIKDGNGLGTMIKEKLGGKKLTDLTGEDSKYCEVPDKTMTFTGSKAYGKRVYVLTSDRTVLSAQAMAGAIRSSGQGTLVGTNTSGEGMSGYSVSACPNSNIVVSWCPYLEIGPDNTPINVTGIRPDTYSYPSMDSFRKRLRQEQEGRDIYNYENRMLWDNVLKSTVEMMTEEK